MPKKISFNAKKQARRKSALEQLKRRVGNIKDIKKQNKAIEEISTLDLRLH